MPPVISVEHLSKVYHLGLIGTGTFSHDLEVWWAKTRGKPNPMLKIGETDHGNRDGEELWALRDVSFTVEQGEALGIIGSNGAGKSTLLKILSRVTAPTNGRVKVKGRIASLLEVGTGFHPELTGRENITLNGAILGMNKAEISRKFDEIVDFSGVEKFIDTPVKRYSSGMYVRLAFAVAAHLDPEILIVDEVLAVGDAEFQKKCLGKMSDVAQHGRTVLFVSHNMGAINKLCSTSIWLETGTIKMEGASHELVSTYLASAFNTGACVEYTRRPDSKAQILRVRLLNENSQETTNFSVGQEPTVEITFTLNDRFRGIHVACIVAASDGLHLFSTVDTDTNPHLFGDREIGEYTARVRLPTCVLNTGCYTVSVGLGIPGIESFDRQDALAFTLYDTGDFGTLKEGARRAGLLLVQVPWHYLNGEIK